MTKHADSQVEKAISIYYDNILPHRNIIGKWMDIVFYHTEFSKNEITELLEYNSFKILDIETEYPNMDKINNIFKKFPVLRFMCGEFFIIAKKK